jgi:oligopeptide transport system permease protein
MVLATFLSRTFARASLAIIGLITLLCVFGPLLSGHSYERVYRDYVLVRPSLFAHPAAPEIREALASIARHLHVQAEVFYQGRGKLRLILESNKPVDRRHCGSLSAPMFLDPPRLPIQKRRSAA